MWRLWCDRIILQCDKIYQPYDKTAVAFIPQIQYNTIQYWTIFCHNAGVNFIHNHHPPRTPEDLHQKFAPTLALLNPKFCPRGGHLSIKYFCHFWNFHYNGITSDRQHFGVYLLLWNFICFKKKIIQHLIEPKLKNENDFFYRRLRMRNSLIVRHLILRVLWKICLYK